MRMPTKMQMLNGITVLMTCSAAVALAAWGWQASHAPTPVSPPAPQRVADWRAYSRGGTGSGDVGAPVTVVVFSDYQCPFCREASLDLDSLAREQPHLMHVVFRQYPLNVHRDAVPAALAAICADKQHVFDRFHHALFAQQQVIGKKSLLSFAS